MNNVTRNDVDRLMQLMHDEENTTRDSAQREYAREEANALANFDRIGAAIHCPHCSKPIGPFAVLMVYLLKHLDGILSFIAGNAMQREPVQGRIKDVRVYLVLLRAMIEREDKQQPEAPLCGIKSPSHKWSCELPAGHPVGGNRHNQHRAKQNPDDSSSPYVTWGDPGA